MDGRKRTAERVPDSFSSSLGILRTQFSGDKSQVLQMRRGENTNTKEVSARRTNAYRSRECRE